MFLFGGSDSRIEMTMTTFTYTDNFYKYQIDSEEWREDVKLAGIIIWNTFINGIISAIDRGNNLESPI